MSFSVKNSLFVRNLSPQVTESILREIFEPCDEIEKIFFKPYPNSSSQFFAQVDFRSSKGVADGSKLSGTCILGTPCICGVIDPVSLAAQEQARALAAQAAGVGVAMDLEAIQAQYLKQVEEAAEDLRMRTVHVAGLADDTTMDHLKSLCAGLGGELSNARIDTDGQGNTFALVEFTERLPAEKAKINRTFFVEGRILAFTEAKTFVDATSLTEKTVQFQAPILDAHNMRYVLAQQGQLSEKLAKVRAAARQILGGEEPAQEEQPGEKKDDKKEKKHKKDGKDKKEKTRDKEKTPRSGRSHSRSRRREQKDGKDRSRRRKEGKEREGRSRRDRQGHEDEDERRRRRHKEGKEGKEGRDGDRRKHRRDGDERKAERGSDRKRRRDAGDEEEAKEPGAKDENQVTALTAAALEALAAPAAKAGSEDSSSDDSTIELDSEVEVVANTELLVLGTSASSSSSSSSERGASPARDDGFPDDGEAIELDDADDAKSEACDVEEDEFDLEVKWADIKRPPPAVVRRRRPLVARPMPPRTVAPVRARIPSTMIVG